MSKAQELLNTIEARIRWQDAAKNFMDWLATVNIGDLEYAKSGSYDKDFVKWMKNNRIKLSPVDREAALEKIRSF